MNATRSRFVLLRVGALGAGAALLLLAACEAKVPTAADVASLDVARAEKSAAEAGWMRTPAGNTTDFFVNGVKVTAETARSMESKNIGSVEVVKSERTGGRDTIFVTTLDRMPRVERVVAGSASKSDAERSLLPQKVLLDSMEHAVAHADGELAMVRVTGQGTLTPDSKPRVMLRTPAGTAGDPMFMIDGRKVSSTEFGAMRGDDIASVSVYKGEQALRFSSDPAARNGVIVVKTKAAAKAN